MTIHNHYNHNQLSIGGKCQVGRKCKPEAIQFGPTLHHYIYIVIISNPTGGHLKIITFVTYRIDTLRRYIYIIIIIMKQVQR